MNVNIAMMFRTVTIPILVLLDGVASYYFVTEPGFYKYVAAITTPAGVCTGTIITTEWVLTAAHCLYLDGQVMDVETMTVLAGITNYEYPREDTGQVRKISEVRVHPRFWVNRLAKFDIALIRVNDFFEFNDYVGNIKIAKDGWSKKNEHPENCMSFGFGGYPDNDSPVKVLKVWNVTAGYGADNCPCSRRFQYRRLLCAKNADYAKLCRGDDGGPLVCGSVVRGIAHMVRFWYDCAEEPKYPMENCDGSPDRGLSIYTMLCPFNTWMHDVVMEIPRTPAACRASPRVQSAAVTLFIFTLTLIK